MEENLTFAKGTNPNELGILQLAYVGDAVMELYARREVLSQGNYPSGKLVKMSKAFVTCEAQSDAVERILPYLPKRKRRSISAAPMPRRIFHPPTVS